MKATLDGYPLESRETMEVVDPVTLQPPHALFPTQEADQEPFYYALQMAVQGGDGRCVDLYKSGSF